MNFDRETAGLFIRYCYDTKLYSRMIKPNGETECFGEDLSSLFKQGVPRPINFLVQIRDNSFCVTSRGSFFSSFRDTLFVYSYTQKYSPEVKLDKVIVFDHAKLFSHVFDYKYVPSAGAEVHYGVVRVGKDYIILTFATYALQERKEEKKEKKKAKG